MLPTAAKLSLYVSSCCVEDGLELTCGTVGGHGGGAKQEEQSHDTVVLLNTPQLSRKRNRHSRVGLLSILETGVGYQRRAPTNHGHGDSPVMMYSGPGERCKSLPRTKV